jgi:hypothetical protein
LNSEKQIRLKGKSFFSTKSFAPLQLYRFPLPKTSFISFLPFKCSSRLKRKRANSPFEGIFSPLIRLFLVRNRKFYPSLCPAAFQNKLTASGFHSGAEPEFTVPLHLTGLISTLHGIFSYILMVLKNKIDVLV